MALITARLRADYLAIVTLGFAESMRITAANEIWLTNGTDGIAGIPGPMARHTRSAPVQPGVSRDRHCSADRNVLVMQRLSLSPFGRVLRAIRDDEQVAAVARQACAGVQSEGLRFRRRRARDGRRAVCASTSYIAPDIFAPLLTLNIMLALVAGGLGNNCGAVLGAVLIMTLLEGTRFAAPFLPFLAPAQLAAVRELLVSVLLLVILRVLPEGIIAERVPEPAPARQRR